jgi:hypothetical protein
MGFLKAVLFPFLVLAGLLGAGASAILRASGVDHSSRAAQISMIVLLGALLWFILHALMFAAVFVELLPPLLYGMLSMLLPVLVLPSLVIACLRVWAPDREGLAGRTRRAASR